jgi:glutamate carboxypeptidase
MEAELRNFFETNLDQYLETLREMVSINSFTANPAGVNQVGKLTAGKFKRLGFEAEFVQSANPDFGKHLVLTRKGHSDRKIGLITHLDTVFPPEEEAAQDFTWRVEGDRVYGPGTNDIKGGTVMMLMVMEAIQKFAEAVYEDVTWIIFGNAAEERWSNDFGELCRQHLGKKALAALVFEAGYYEENQLSLVTARKGMAVYDIHVEGKSAHAGNGHQSGANAIVQMAEIIQKIAALTDYEQDLTFNIGVLSGGTVPNRVPHYSEARGEMRTFSKDVFDSALDDLLALKNTPTLQSVDGEYRCNIDIQVLLENAPWPPNPDTNRLFSLWERTAHSLGMTVIREERGGLSDGNQLWNSVPTLDGLGPNGRNAHCSERTPDGSKDQEYATISSFVPKAILNTLAVLKLVSQG